MEISMAELEKAKQDRETVCFGESCRLCKTKLSNSEVMQNFVVCQECADEHGFGN